MIIFARCLALAKIKFLPSSLILYMSAEMASKKFVEDHHIPFLPDFPRYKSNGHPRYALLDICDDWARNTV
jgi:hypothetical protein